MPNLRFPAVRARLPDPPLNGGGSGTPTDGLATDVATLVCGPPLSASNAGVVYMNVADCHPHSGCAASGPEYVNMTPDLVGSGGRSKWSFFTFCFVFHFGDFF